MAANKDEISKKVVDIIVERMEVSRDRVKPETRLVEDLGADSLDIAELVMELEEAFDISIPDDEEGVRSVGDAVNFIVKQLEQTAE
ncbi:MAG TPA: acyl carrier protein [Planctomycetes bacterium]|nr:acyl carrier protein [Planctomycetota bacterium]